MNNRLRLAHSLLGDPARGRVSTTAAWALVRGLACAGVPQGKRGVALVGEEVEFVDAAAAMIELDECAPRGYRKVAELDADAAQILDLFLPLCGASGAKDVVVGHIAQSLDGRIATLTGESKFISGPEDLEHTHRLRAVCDAVIVGVRTVVSDDPLLTTRRVPGRSPTRIILDPAGRIPQNARVLCDEAAPTLVVCGPSPVRNLPGHVRSLPTELEDGRIELVGLRERLKELGLRRLFVEGGGVTLSRFLESGLLDRMHVAVAPTILGSGRPSFQLPALERLEEGVQLSWTRYRMGADILLDCELPSRVLFPGSS